MDSSPARVRRLQPVGLAPWRTFPGARWHFPQIPGLKPACTSRFRAAYAGIQRFRCVRNRRALRADGGQFDRSKGSVQMSATGAGPGHVPVMLDEVVALLSPALQPESAATTQPVLVDGTLGLGGHAAALLTQCPQARLVGLDCDPDALTAASDRLQPFADRIELVRARFDEMDAVLSRLGIPRVQAVLLDLGLSSIQIDNTDRGFAYAVDAALDMRMDPDQSLTAAGVLAQYSQPELNRVLYRLGEERFAGRIAAGVVAAREEKPIQTSAELVEVILAALPARARHDPSGHPAKRTFQALRIEVNGELESLRQVLPDAVGALATDGRIAVLAYHSLEDRIVKQMLAAGARDRAPRDLPVVPAQLQPELRLLTNKPMRPTSNEKQINPRASSARLRAAARIRSPEQTAA